jgi:hypothetical protein
MEAEELMFYAACIRANQWRYSYGRQANRTLKDLMIPAREAIPSWVYEAFTRVADQLIQKESGMKEAVINAAETMRPSNLP